MSAEIQTTPEVDHVSPEEAVASAARAVLYMRGFLAQKIFSVIEEAGAEGICMKEVKKIAGIGTHALRLHAKVLQKHKIIERKREDKKSGSTILSLARTAHTAIIQELRNMIKNDRTEAHERSADEENRVIHEAIMRKLSPGSQEQRS